MNAAPRAAAAEDRDRRSKPARTPPPGDAEVDDRLAPAVEHRVHERAERADLAGRAGERAVEHVEDAADEDDDAADDPQLRSEQGGTDDGDPEADERQPVRVSGRAGPSPSAIGSKTFLIRPRDSFEIVIVDQPATPRIARSRAANSVNASSRRRQIVSRPCRRVSTTPAARRRPRCHDTSGWRQPDMGDELGDGRLAVGQAADDAQPVDVGHDLVEGTQLAEVFGLGDGRGDGAADPGGRGGQG